MRRPKNQNGGFGRFARSWYRLSWQGCSASRTCGRAGAMRPSIAQATYSRSFWRRGCGRATTGTACHSISSACPTSWLRQKFCTARVITHDSESPLGRSSRQPTPATSLRRRGLVRETATRSSFAVRFTATWAILTALCSMQFAGFETDHASNKRPNPAHLTRPSRSGCNPRLPPAGSLSFCR